MTDFEDVVLPIFDQPEPKQARVLTHKEQDDKDNKIVYRRYKPAKPFLCELCVSEYDKGYRKDIRDATYIRIAPTGTVYICYPHKQDMTDTDALKGLQVKK